MNEKTLEKVTGLSRRQIIMLQKIVIQRKNKVVVGLSYDYSAEEVKEFMIAKILKICGYSYEEIKLEMIEYRKDETAVLDKAILKLENNIENLKKDLVVVYEFKKKEQNKEESI